MATASDAKKILIIDDEQDIVDLISEVLSRDRYEPIVATRWTEALEAISSAKPDLMLLDLKMPTIDGSAILEFIRKEGIPLPVIVVSGFLTDDVIERLSSLGVAAFIRKPFKVGLLKSEIERVIGESTPPVTPATPSDKATPEQELLSAFRKLQGDAPAQPTEAAPSAEDEPSTEAPAHESEILNAFEKLKSPSDAQGPPPVAPPNRDATSAPSAPEEVAEAFKKLSGEPAAAPSAPEAPPPSPQARSTAPRPSPQAESPAPDADTADTEVPLESEEHRRHRSHAHRRHRPRGASRRNLLYMGIITVACIAIAGFLALMQWYASQVSVEEIKSGVQKSMQDQLKQELKKELQKSP